MLVSPSLTQHSTKSLNLLKEILLVFFGVCFIAGMTQLAIPLWFSPVPMTLQTLAILMIAGVYGSKRGSFTVLTYLFHGALGLPLFAGAQFGLIRLFGPTGGYLIGFFLSAYFTGLLLERARNASFAVTLMIQLLGALIILSCGALWLSCLLGTSKGFLLGFVPFIAGDAIKAVVAATCLLSLKKRGIALS